MTTTKVPQDMIDGQGTAAVLNVGTSADNIVQLNSSAELPAVSGANLTGITASTMFQHAEVSLSGKNTTTFSGFSAGNTRILIVIDGMVAGTDGSDPIIQLGDAGGLETSGYVGITVDHLGSGEPEDETVTTHIPLTSSGAPSLAAGVNHIKVELIKSSEVTEKWTAYTEYWQLVAGTELVVGVCSKTLSAEITQIKLFSDDSTNWDAGTAILYRDVE